jgi:hypothetical protein
MHLKVRRIQKLCITRFIRDLWTSRRVKCKLQHGARLYNWPVACFILFRARKLHVSPEIRVVAPLRTLSVASLIVNLNINSLKNHSSRSFWNHVGHNRSKAMKIAQIAIHGKSARCRDKRTALQITIMYDTVFLIVQSYEKLFVGRLVHCGMASQCTSCEDI